MKTACGGIISAVYSRRRGNTGSALITVVMVMMMVSMFGMAYVSLTTTNLLRANRDQRRATAFYLAEAGMEYTIAEVSSRAGNSNGQVASWTFDSTSLLSAQVEDASGSVTVTPEGSMNDYALIVSSATYRGVTETVRVRMKARDVSIWNNAIFAGNGQSGRGITGNVDIRGSVHILGSGDPYSDLNGNGQWDPAEPYIDSNGNGQYDSGEPFTDIDGNGVWSSAEPFQDSNMNGVYDPPLTATDLAGDLIGNAHMGNNYDGIPAILQSRIPALVPETIGGESVYTLKAELRVKHGKVNISGSATAGSPNVSGNSVRETLEGVYVSDGFGGNRGTGSVYSDNGTTNRYDLGDRISFPSLMSAYTDPVTGIQYASYESYLDANSMSIPATKIDTTTTGFSYTDGTNSISWDQSTNVLTINGIVRLMGGLDLGEKNSTMHFSGRGTLYCKGDIRVHGSILPLNEFPTTDSMGFVGRQNIYFATGAGESQLYAAGAWFAQGQIVSAKQNQFAGTYVANYFDMGTNVPNIYQVPTLKDNLPPGMPGTDVKIVVAKVLSWRHL